jgi:hypothetical protein
MSQLQYISAARAGGFVSGSGIRRYVISHQTPTTTVTGQTSWVATTPTFMLYKTSSNTTTRTIISLISLEQTGTAAVGAISLIGCIDPTNRYSSGGTAVVPKLTSLQQVDSGTTPDFTFRYNPTASAASGTADLVPRYFNCGTFPAVTGTTLPTIDCQDEFVIKGPGTFMLYTQAATTGPTWNFTFEVIEEALVGGDL